MVTRKGSRRFGTIELDNIGWDKVGALAFGAIFLIFILAMLLINKNNNICAFKESTLLIVEYDIFQNIIIGGYYRGENII